MPIDKDRSIVMQVAAKIAADLTNTQQEQGVMLTEWATNFTFVTETLFEKHGFNETVPSFSPTTQSFTIDQAAAAIEQNFQATPVASLRVKGDQHGPLPDWLFPMAAAAGVTEVYDNRDGLRDNPKRPWFKSTSGGQQAPAFWPPR